MLELNKAVAVRIPLSSSQASADEVMGGQQTNVYNASVAEVVELFTTYLRNVRFNLESTGTLEPPL